MLKTKQVLEAIEQMKVTCSNNMESEQYDVVSARGLLYSLGYHGQDCEQVLHNIYDGGFTYCLDSHYHKGNEAVISQDVCYWGPDQLLSRLDSLSW